MALNISASKEQLIVIDKNGNLKLINASDKVLSGEILLNNGNENVSLDPNDIPEENNRDIEDILNVIIDGEDPSLITEAPAAGEDSGSSLTTSAEIERTGKSSIAETDFDTSSLEAIGFSKTQSLTLLEQYKAYRENDSIDNESSKGTNNIAINNVVDDDSRANLVSENAEVGSVVNITGLAIDPDGDDVTYALSQEDIDAGLFAIDETTGVVTLIGNLDHEVADSHSITIIATSTDGSTSQESFDITVTDADGSTPGGGDTDNDVGPITDSNTAENTLSENAEIGSVVNITGLAVDPDGDEVSYKLSDADTAKGLFAIDATTGVVTLIGNLDHEVADSHSITIIATSTDGSTSQESFDITVTDADGSTPGGGDTDNDVGPVTDSNAAENTLSENAEIGSVVNITGLAVDPDGDDVTYALSQTDIDAGLFAIDATTGVVTLIGNLDHEVADSHSITIIATSTDGSTSEASFDITVTDADGSTPGGGDTDNDVGPVTDSNAADNTISENAEVGTVVNITGLATDPDGDDVTYALSQADIDAGLFEIDATTGVVTLIGNLDHEVADSHSITIIATSTDGSTSQESFDITVTDADGSTPGDGDTDNDVGPVTDSNAADNTISENAEIGSVVNITGLATDPDGDDVTYALSQADIDAGLFDIDATTGVVTLIGNLDHEVADSHSITIIATSTDGSTSEASFDITVTDADGSIPGGGDTDNDVGPVTDSNTAENTLSENAEIGTVVNITGLAVDPDGDDVSYTLSDADIAKGLFAIDATTGVVTLIGNLDHEAADSHSITIIATSTDGSTSEASFDITVTDADGSIPGGGDTDNDVGSVTDSNAADNTISENAEIGSVVNITGLATDPDGDDVTYALSQADIDAGLFEIDATTGVVTLIGNLDHEVADSHSITIIATSTDGSTSQESFDITVTDADGSTPGDGDTDNDVGSVTDSNAADNTISENAEIGTVVNITGLATDPDGDDVTYALSQTDIDAGLFAIDATTGMVSLIGNIDHDTADSHSITIIATSTDGSTSEASFGITVTDADGSTPGGGDTDNDVGPVTDSNAADNTISENAEIGSVVNITGLAVDPDGDDVSYTLSDADIAKGLFAIDATTGVVMLIGNLDHEVADSHSITIIATSTDGSTNEASFDITVTDADGSIPGGGDADNDVGPVTDSNAAENTLSENAEIGTVVNITGLAVDPDGDDVTYALSQADIDAGLFEIDATTGVVTLIGNLDHEVADSHSITIIATSTDGSTSQESFDITVTDIDEIPPNPPTITLDTDSGKLGDDLLTNDGSFTVTPSEVGNTVEYQAADGSWSTTPPEVAEGDNSITVRETDAAGNVSGSNTLDFVLDTQAPNAPTITLDVDSGISNGDLLTNDGSFTVTPSEVGNTVEYFVNGEWTTDEPTATEGNNSIVVRETDAAGNVSGSNTLDFVLDTQAPNAPTITLDVDSGISNGDLLTNDGSFTVTPSEDGNTVEYFVNGEWTTDAPTATEGANSITVRETDAAGNVSGSNTLDFVLDTQAPNAPSITLDTDSGKLGNDFLTNDGSFTVTSSEVGNTVEYQAADGSWSTTPPEVVEGDNSITVRETDAAGNVSGSNTLDFVLDTQAPNAPTITLDVDSGISNGDLLTNDGSFTVTPSEVGNTVEYQAADGSWSTTPPAVVEGDNSITVRETDAAGNVSGSNTLDFVLDTSANAGSVIVDNITEDDVINASESGESIMVSGTAIGGDISKDDVVTMIINGQSYDTTVNQDGSWSVAVDGGDLAADTEFEVSVSSSDDAGNIVESKVTSLHTVDTQTGTDGAAPTVVITEDTSPNDGLISASELVGDIDVSIGLPTGALEGEIITVSDGNTTKEITLTAAHLIAGTITTTFPSPGEGNEIKVTATLTDQYGNESETGEDVAVIDTLAEVGAVTVADITEDGVINASESGETIIVTGTAIDGDISKDDVVTMIINGQSYETVVNQDGTWSVEVAGSDLAEDTEFEVVVKSSDDAGNTVESKGTSTHTVDTDVLTETDGDGNTGITSDITDATNSGSNDDTITNDATPDITGVTEAGAKVTITYRDASDTLRTATSTASANGVYTIAILHALAEGFNLIDIVAVDSAGNTVSTTQDVTVDTKVLTETGGDGDLGITSDITDNTNTGSNSDTVTNNTTPDITGVTEAGAKVTITYTDKDGVIHTTDEVTANQNGEYTISLPYQLNEGANALTVTAIDIAGNKTEVIQDVTINADPIANDFDIQLVDDISTQFSFDAYVSDLEDDENDTDNKFVEITITDSPEFGTLYVVDGDTRTEITSSTVLTESDQIEYVLDGSINDDLSFNAQEDFAPNYSNGSVNSFTLASGVIISGGQFTGDSPDNTSTLTPETLYYDNVAQETGLGVGNSEIDVKTKDYVEIDFSNVGSPNTTEVVVTEVNMDFGSVWGNYSENSSADAKVQVLLFKDGVLVGESPYTFDDESKGIYDGSGEFTANIQLDSGFDQIRVYTIHGEGSTSANSNLTLQGVEVVDAMVSEDIHYQATDSDDAIDTGVITISTDSTDKATNNAPIVDNSVFSETYEDVAIPLNLNELLISDLDGDDVTLTNITVDPAFGSLELIFNGDEVIGAIFTPVENKHFDSNSPVEFTVTVSDGHKTSTGTAEMVVNAQADKPTVSLVLGEPVITNSAPNFDTSDVEAIKEYFENGGTIPGVGNVTYNAAMVVADDGNNLIIGTPLGDNLIGDAVHGTGNDVFVGGGLNDSIYGGTGPLDSGIDAVIYSGSIDEYLITNQGGAHGGGVDHWVVTDTLGRDTGYDHTAPEDNGDQLYHIERLVFSDAIVELNPDGSYTIIQNVEIPLDLSASVTDLDGSESLESLVLSGLSENAVILDENKQPIGTYDEATGNWILPVGAGNQTVDFSNLSIQVPKPESDFTLKATATAIEASNSDTSSGDAEATLPQDILVDQGGSLPTTLITLALDSSGSMGDVEVDDKERMQLVLESSIKLLEDIQNQPNSGTVQVQLIDFDNRHSDETNDTATSLGWYSVADAITHLQDAIEIEMISDPYHIGGGTDYSEAIYAILDGYSNDKAPNDVDLSNTNDVIYFISDGHNNEVIPADLLVQWNEFIEDKEVKAVGVINDGTNNLYLGGLTDISDNIIYIEDKELYTVLPQLKPTIGQQGALTGSLTGIANSELVIETSKINILKVIDQDGNVSSESVDINLYEEKLQLVTDYGNLLINKDGSYLFQPIDNPTLIDSGKSVTYELAYTVIDGEGVEHLQQATLNVSPSDETNIQINHSLSGSTNNDVVIGSDEDDVIFAHQGNDILIGGLGDDILVGGIGDDIFKWVDQGADSGVDTIKDFTKGEDLIDITEILNDDVHQNDLNDLLEHITISEDGDDFTLSITDYAGKDHTIVVEGGIGSFGLDNTNLSNQAEILTKLLDEQLFKLDDAI
ncbi:cadherin domain-containing protein [Aliivibrio fischeri]|uniref:cadherin domain-containing protein n=2 Tax=Aliivibrio fischeri TaxID=668 RepID=UPI0012DAD354|nr:cadherin domain-containing protein [Aliivibrio fischeri]MUJ36926.1 Ig-like domain-containing protein [Aliivibrio fischeri]